MNKQRLNRIARRLGAVASGEICPECGYRPNETPKRFSATCPTWGEELAKPAYCPRCGRQTRYVVSWGDFADETED